MLGRILFITGLIFVLLGAAGTVALIVEPFARAIKVVFGRNDDYVFYETRQGRQLLEKSYGLLRSAIILSIVCGVVLMVTGHYLIHATAADGSITETGAYEQNGEEVPFSPEEGFVHEIRITGQDIYYDDALLETGLSGMEELASGTIGRDEKILLKDDFASSAAYRGVKEILDRYALLYEEGQ